ncbi:MAG: hypothetical protein H6Q89_2673 [Myxococcaceae bacterium]|nr:hypothetical protein [Myxococcaceae bacterium]
MSEDTTAAERRALELLRQHDPALSVRPGAAARVEARLHRPAKKPRYVGPLVIAAIALSTASFAAKALFWPAPVTPVTPRVVSAPVVQAAPEPVAVPAPRGSSLLEEARLLERVAQELKKGQVTEALAGVEAHEAKYPFGVLRLEALGFRVQAFEQLGAENVTAAMAEQWVAALSDLGRCSDAARLARQSAPAQREAFNRALKGFCSP